MIINSNSKLNQYDYLSYFCFGNSSINGSASKTVIILFSSLRLTNIMKSTR